MRIGEERCARKIITLSLCHIENLSSTSPRLFFKRKKLL
jgi:hypothetical protein